MTVWVAPMAVTVDVLKVNVLVRVILVVLWSFGAAKTVKNSNINHCLYRLRGQDLPGYQKVPQTRSGHSNYSLCPRPS